MIIICPKTVAYNNCNFIIFLVVIVTVVASKSDHNLSKNGYIFISNFTILLVVIVTVVVFHVRLFNLPLGLLLGSRDNILWHSLEFPASLC